jgi:AraC-like DNA-binding protein
MPKRGTLKTTRIGLLLSEKTEYGRGVLRGIADFAKDNPHLRFRVEDPGRAGLAAMDAWPADGLIVMLNDKSLTPRLLALGRPTVTVCNLPGVVARGSTRQLVPDDPVLAKAMAVIHESVATPLSVADLLKEVPVSRISLERRFRRLLDRTPAQEIRRVRIAQARQLLMATDLPLKSIAERCGFAAASRLIEAFRRETGSTPGEYRVRTARQRR